MGSIKLYEVNIVQNIINKSEHVITFQNSDTVNFGKLIMQKSAKILYRIQLCLLKTSLQENSFVADFLSVGKGLSLTNVDK